MGKVWYQLGLVLLCFLAMTNAIGFHHFLGYREEQPSETRIKPLPDTVERLAEHGYESETHSVVTEDGYVLTMFRIPRSHRWPTDRTRQRPVVLLMHGLLCTSDFWVLNGPQDGLPFMLADAGYDVWFGNARGSHYSRNHTTMSTTNSSFWRFSWHEIGRYDLPAMIDYALETNGQGQKSIHYVGHSQGTTAFFVLLSTRPEYNAKIKTANLLAPVAYIDHSPSQAIRILSPYLGYANTVSRLVGSQEFMPYNDLLLLVFFNSCGKSGVFYEVCSKLLPATGDVMGMRGHNETIVGYFAEIFPGGSSTDQLLHYLQLHRSGRFQHFDFGTSDNRMMYGQHEPPSYRLEEIGARLHLWYSDNDSMAAVTDVLRLAKRLPNRVMHHMEDPLWGHGDFLYSLRVKELINDPMINILNEYEDRSNAVRRR